MRAQDRRHPLQGVSVLVNIALDPLFMFTFGWGVWGASVATVVSQALAAIALMWLVYKKGRKYVTFNPRHFRPSSKILSDITRIGSPASFSMLLTALGGALFNRILVRFSADAVAATTVAKEGAWIAVTVESAPKCVRCWHRRADVGSDPAHPGICGRCAGNLELPGETRKFA